MKMKFKGYQIIYLDKNSILLFRNFSVYQYDNNTEIMQRVCNIPADTKKNILCRFRISNRLLRLAPKCCEKLSDNLFVFSLCNKIWAVNTNEDTVSVINTERNGFGTPLNLCRCFNKIYWGDYGSNSTYKSVNIYELNQDLRFQTVYSFLAGSVRHIHNIIYDKVQNCFWIMTGDNENKAGIFKATKDLGEIAPFKIGEQKFRAVVGFPYNDGILYATDSVEKENHLYYIDKDGKEKILTSINGSCIYGTEIKDYFIFSTTVESPEGGGYLKLLSTRLGRGIKNREVHLIAVRKSDLAVRVIRKYKKDIWPMKLFQYGTLMFPAGQEQSEDLWCYGVACKGIDGKNIHISKDEIDGKFIQNT